MSFISDLSGTINELHGVFFGKFMLIWTMHEPVFFKKFQYDER